MRMKLCVCILDDTLSPKWPNSCIEQLKFVQERELNEDARGKPVCVGSAHLIRAIFHD